MPISVGESVVSFEFRAFLMIRATWLSLLAHPTRFERVTFAFGGQRFDTEALERLGAVRPQILPRLILCGGLLFIWK